MKIIIFLIFFCILFSCKKETFNDLINQVGESTSSQDLSGYWYPTIGSPEDVIYLNFLNNNTLIQRKRLITPADSNIYQIEYKYSIDKDILTLVYNTVSSTTHGIDTLIPQIVKIKFLIFNVSGQQGNQEKNTYIKLDYFEYSNSVYFYEKNK